VGGQLGKGDGGRTRRARLERRETDRQTDRQTDRRGEKERQTERKEKKGQARTSILFFARFEPCCFLDVISRRLISDLFHDSLILLFT